MHAARSTQIDWNSVDAEVVAHLQSLIRLDTRNPPGHETRAAEFLRDVLAHDGIASQIVGPAPDRGTLVARINGDGTAPPLLLMSHTDVVAVEASKWSQPPFAANIVEGMIYGRGALDMKHMVAMELETMLLLQRSGVHLRRDVIFMAAADEEVGGHQGAGWVVANCPALIAAEYALNEGGGAGMELNGRIYYPVQTAEKGTAHLRLRAHGTPGHGSEPHADNAIVKLAEALQKLKTARLPVHWTTTVRAHFKAVAATQPPAVAELLQAILDARDPDTIIDQLPLPDSLKLSYHSVLRNTVAPTLLTAGSQINVIPSEAEAGLDARLLPGWTPEQLRAELQPIFGTELDLEFSDSSPPLEADPNSPLFDTIVAVLRERDAQATAVPILLSGATDAKHVARLGTRVYGFAPGLHPTDWSRIHGHDEQISVASLQWGARTLFEVVARFAGG